MPDPPIISYEKFEDKDILALLTALQPYVADMSLDADTKWFSQVISSAIKEYSGIDVDPDSIRNIHLTCLKLVKLLTGTEADIPQIPKIQ